MGNVSVRGTRFCALCDRSLTEHRLGIDGTSRHQYISRRDFAKLDPVAQLKLSTAYADAEHALPRCEHGTALRDHAGAQLAPSCGCRIVGDRIVARDNLVLVHADGGACHGMEVAGRACTGCGISPDMQSTEFWPRDQVKRRKESP